jgi:hypothetical protein
MPTPKKRPERRCKGIGISLEQGEIDRIDALCADGQRSQLLRYWILDYLVKEEQRRSTSNQAYVLLGGEQ